MIEFRPYAAGDEIGIKSPDSCIGTVPNNNKAVTCLSDGEPVAVIGCSDFFPNVGLLWAIVDNECVRNFGAMFTRKARKELDVVVQERQYHRVQAFVYDNYCRNGHWLRVLGLDFESCMVKGAPNGNDMHVYARVI